MTPPGRALTIAAAGFLLLDAALLAWAGLEIHRPALVVVAAVFACGAIAVPFGWRRYRRTLSELDAARGEMRRETEELRALLSRHTRPQ
ncbi:MAG TPA: hypothetical protein VNG95_05695 [Gemmatimonadales bacterium]|nr:hypothetical protein [Gemmatimonadales bacterium]